MKRKFWLLPMTIVAIGSGQAATAKDAQEVCLLIRNKLEKLFSADIARKVRVLYGGSVNAKNAADFAISGIDGVLVGGASLDGASVFCYRTQYIRGDRKWQNSRYC